MDIVASRDIDLSPPTAKPKEREKSSATTALAHAIPRLYGYFYPRIGGDRQTGGSDAGHHAHRRPIR